MLRRSILKRAGYLFIALALVILTFVSMTPELAVPIVVVYSYALFGLGLSLLLAERGWVIIQYLRLNRRKAFCLRCGWVGSGFEWYRYESCPECDSEDVSMS